MGHEMLLALQLQDAKSALFATLQLFVHITGVLTTTPKVVKGLYMVLRS